MKQDKSADSEMGAKSRIPAGPWSGLPYDLRGSDNAPIPNISERT